MGQYQESWLLPIKGYIIFLCPTINNLQVHLELLPNYILSASSNCIYPTHIPCFAAPYFISISNTPLQREESWKDICFHSIHSQLVYWLSSHKHLPSYSYPHSKISLISPIRQFSTCNKYLSHSVRYSNLLYALVRFVNAAFSFFPLARLFYKDHRGTWFIHPFPFLVYTRSALIASFRYGLSVDFTSNFHSAQVVWDTVLITL